jgi:reactive intermediate/imine deaminase
VRLISLVALLLFFPQSFSAQMRVVTPAGGLPPIGPYSPGISAGDYLYVSGQGAIASDGSIPVEFIEQVRQTLRNVKAIVEADGLTMEHVVYTQVYLEDMTKFDEMNRICTEFFPKAPPARATLGVADLPANTPVEISAVAVRDLANKRVVNLARFDLGEPISPGILTHDRLFVSGMRGRDLKTGKVPREATAQVELALDGLRAVVEAAGLTLGHMVFVNPYLTSDIPMELMNDLYAKRFEFGNTPARATIRAASLPQGAQIEFTGVAVKDLSQRRAVRPKNMPRSPTASPCVFAGDTLYCSAKSGFIPGPNSGIYAATVEHQVRQTMRNLLDGLEEAGMDFSQVVASNVYLDDIADFPLMNRVYRQYFAAAPPARTTIQQITPGKREPDSEGRYPALEQISIMAVKPGSGR